ncbi:hypothetical protein ACF073_26280 [Streptomyces sp. NPDC015171]|uniref:hypothetical protein n=1 Tax=Streptomyces sp. NPDC015171 TaxID=3364945 RepID=UPI0036F972C0
MTALSAQPAQQPNLAPLTHVSYEGSVRDVREWISKLAVTCRCCAQGKNASAAGSGALLRDR